MTFWGQANGIILGIVIAYAIMISDAFFGTPEDIEKGRKRLRDNKGLMDEFFQESYTFWQERFNTLLNKKPSNRDGNNNLQDEVQLVPSFDDAKEDPKV